MSRLSDLIEARIQAGAKLREKSGKPREIIVGMAWSKEPVEIEPGQSRDLVGGETSHAWKPRRIVFPKQMLGMELLGVKVSRGYKKPVETIEFAPRTLDDSDWTAEVPIEVGTIGISGRLYVTVKNTGKEKASVNFAACGLLVEDANV